MALILEHCTLWTSQHRSQVLVVVMGIALHSLVIRREYCPADIPATLLFVFEQTHIQQDWHTVDFRQVFGPYI